MVYTLFVPLPWEAGWVDCRDEVVGQVEAEDCFQQRQVDSPAQGRDPWRKIWLLGWNEPI